MDVTVRNLTIGEGKPKICVLVMGKNNGGRIGLLRESLTRTSTMRFFRK